MLLSLFKTATGSRKRQICGLESYMFNQYSLATFLLTLSPASGGFAYRFQQYLWILCWLELQRRCYLRCISAPLLQCLFHEMLVCSAKEDEKSLSCSWANSRYLKLLSSSGLKCLGSHQIISVQINLYLYKATVKKGPCQELKPFQLWPSERKCGASDVTLDRYYRMGTRRGQAFLWVSSQSRPQSLSAHAWRNERLWEDPLKSELWLGFMKTIQTTGSHSEPNKVAESLRRKLVPVCRCCSCNIAFQNM